MYGVWLLGVTAHGFCGLLTGGLGLIPCNHQSRARQPDRAFNPMVFKVAFQEEHRRHPWLSLWMLHGFGKGLGCKFRTPVAEPLGVASLLRLHQRSPFQPREVKAEVGQEVKCPLTCAPQASGYMSVLPICRERACTPHLLLNLSAILTSVDEAQNVHIHAMCHCCHYLFQCVSPCGQLRAFLLGFY